MTIRFTIAAAVIALGTAASLTSVASAQVVVTGARQDRSTNNAYFDSNQAAIGLTRQADFFVKPLFVSSDSRNAATRKQEVRTMLEATMQAAKEQGIALVAGDYSLKPLTAELLEELTYGRGSRPDTTRVRIYARIPVGGSVRRIKEADERINPFVKSIAANGRSYIDTGSTSLAITDPDQYRIDVVKAVAKEAKSYAAQFGADYGVQITGLDGDLYWKQSSETEVFLYIDHSFVIRPS